MLSNNTNHSTTGGNNQTRNDGLPQEWELLFHKIFSIIFCILVMVVGVTGNIMVIVLFSMRWTRLKTCEIFMVGLAIADCISTISVPLNVVLETLEVDFSPIGNQGCPFITWVNYTCVTVSAFFLVAIAIDRYIIVRWPLRAKLPHWKAALFALLTLFLASPLGGVYFFGGRNRLYLMGKSYVCRTFWKSGTEDYIHTIVAFTVQMVIPITMMVCLYTAIWFELRISKNLKLTEDSARINPIRHRRNKKAIRLFLTIVFLFYILVLPNNIFYVLYTFLHFKATRTLYYINAYFNLIQMLNSCVNPIIYARLHTSFRRSALKMLCCCFFSRFKNYDWSSTSLTRRRPRYTSRVISTSGSPLGKGSKGMATRTSHSFLSPVLPSKASSTTKANTTTKPSTDSFEQPVRVGFLPKDEAVRFYAAPNPCYKRQNGNQNSKTTYCKNNKLPSISPTTKYVRFSNPCNRQNSECSVVIAWEENAEDLNQPTLEIVGEENVEEQLLNGTGKQENDSATRGYNFSATQDNIKGSENEDGRSIRLNSIN